MYYFNVNKLWLWVYYYFICKFVLFDKVNVYLYFEGCKVVIKIYFYFKKCVYILKIFDWKNIYKRKFLFCMGKVFIFWLYFYFGKFLVWIIFYVYI